QSLTMPEVRMLVLCHPQASSPCFNLDTEQPTTFRVDSAGFGHGVVQSAHSWVVVGAPQEIKAGGLHQCDYSTGSCEPLCLQGQHLCVHVRVCACVCVHVWVRGPAPVVLMGTKEKEAEQ
uniref:Uncharacterized protein n=1 Tax=Prolemur simus TaxID=1328070 RepID=A0A8C8Z2L8_PROSS